MGRSRDIADFLSKTEAQNTANAKLLHASSNVGVDSAYVTSQTGTIGLTYYNTLDSLPISGLSSGDQAYVEENSRLYLSNGSGWYNAALIRIAPTMTLDPTGTITLANDGVTTSTVTIVANDSDTPGSGLTYSVDSDGNGIGKYVISQDSSVFTIRPLSSDSGATAGTFTLTFSTTDGNNIATDSADFSLTFSTVVDSSAPTVLLMKAAGNSATNAAITYQNSSDVSTGFSEIGNPKASTFSPYRSGGYSAYFDGTGDKLSIGSSSDFAYGTGDFTWEAWIYVPGAKSNHYLLDHGSNGGIMNIANNKIRYYNTTVGTGGALYTGVTIEYSKWHHVAFVRSSGTTKIYVDGVSGASQSDTHNYSAQAVTVGDYGGNNYGFSGYVRDLRLVKGTAVYTSNFTPSTETLTAISGTSLLACHLPYIGDGSSSDHTITVNGDAHTVPFGPYDYNAWAADDHGGSLYTHQNNSYVTSGGVPQVGSTGVAGHLELWWYPVSTTAGSGYSYLFLGNDMASGNYIEWNSNVTRFQIQTGGGVTTQMLWTNANMLHVNSWNHIWIQKNVSNYWDVWINGKNLGTVSSSYGQTHTGAITPQVIGAGFSSTYGGVQYIADMKIGTDIKSNTNDFTPPTAPLTHDANTTFLMNNKSDANVYDAAAGNVFWLLADAQSSTTQRKFTTSSSVYLDGTGDYIELPESQELLTFGTGDFTIECWFRPSVVNRNTAIIDSRPNSTTGNYLFIQPNNTDLRVQNVSSGTLTASGVLSANTWIHIAVVRSNGTTTLYTDGTSRDSGVDTTDYAIRSVPNIGKHNYAGSNLYGYLQDLRITKGYGRYTTNFTPPTAEFEL